MISHFKLSFHIIDFSTISIMNSVISRRAQNVFDSRPMSLVRDSFKRSCDQPPPRSAAGE